MFDKAKKRELGKQLGDARKSIGPRLNVLFAIIFLLFLILLGRLFYMQVINKAYYEGKLAQAGLQSTVKVAMPRGQLFDATGQVLAQTTKTPAVTFTRTSKITAASMRKTSQILVQILGQYVDPSSLTVRDKKDYYLSDPGNLKKIQAATPEKAQYSKTGKRLTDSELYSVFVSQVGEGEVSGFSETDLKTAEIFKQMNATQLYNTSNIVMGDISPAQQAQIAQQEAQLPGISFGTSWDHKVLPDTLLAPVLGTISTQKAGLPAEEKTAYLAKGYSLNDRVGTSYLEKGYEADLQGTRNIVKINADAHGNIKKETVLQKGKAGDNLKLTVDMKFEQGVQDILTSNMETMIAQGYGSYANGAYAVVLNPSTGAILSMNGLDRDPSTGMMTPNALATMTSTFLPGSTVKPATLTAGWQTGVITGNQTLTDQTIQISGSNPINSWFTKGPLPITADQALEYSSNTYMVQLALKILGQPYTPNMTVSDTNRVKAYGELRKAYGQYGLGVDTGIDIPGESTGFIPSTDKATTDTAGVLFESFGQFDMYTPMQMAQYAATIANNGKRLSPYLVEGVYGEDGGKMGDLIRQTSAKNMGAVDISSDDLNTIKKGMDEVVYGNPSMRTGGDIGNGASVRISAKTGTSETYVVLPDGTQIPVTVNNVIAFAPQANPQIAIGVMVPNTTIMGGGATSHISQNITRDIVNLYNSLYGFK